MTKINSFVNAFRMIHRDSMTAQDFYETLCKISDSDFDSIMKIVEDENKHNPCDDCYYNPQCRKCENCLKHCTCEHEDKFSDVAREDTQGLIKKDLLLDDEKVTPESIMAGIPNLEDE